MEDTDIGPWTREEPDYPHELEQWRNTETGGVLVVEENDEPWLEETVYNVVELPPSKEVEDHQDIKHIEKGATKDGAREGVRDRMLFDAPEGEREGQ